MEPESIVKRDGSVVPFDRSRIEVAISRAMQAIGRDDRDLAEELGVTVVDHLVRHSGSAVPGIEEVQDAVVHVLQEYGEYDMALAYIRYRDARERQRRKRRVTGEDQSSPNLFVLGRDCRRRPWDRKILMAYLVNTLELSAKSAEDVALGVESILAESTVTEIAAPLLLSLIDAALVRGGMTATAERRASLRVERPRVESLLSGLLTGESALKEAGREVYRQLSLSDDLPPQVVRAYCGGRLWVDGLDDPLRGSEFTAALDGSNNPWQIISQAFSLATEAKRNWRTVNLIMPPIILGHLERNAQALLAPLEHLSKVASCYLYCDGRTPLLDDWPFKSRQISIATYADDFLLLRKLQDLGLSHISGPHLMQGHYRRRVAVKLALNAQGLDEQYSQMDALAMALVAAARKRQEQLSTNNALAGADIRYAIFGLPPNAPSNEYLERQVVQEGLRCGVALSRSTSLPEEACEHLGRLFE